MGLASDACSEFHVTENPVDFVTEKEELMQAHETHIADLKALHKPLDEHEKELEEACTKHLKELDDRINMYDKVKSELDALNQNLDETNIKLEKITREINFDMIVNQTYEIFFPMLVGGVIIAPLVWIITYYIIYSFIASFKKRRNKKNKRLL